MKVSWDDEILNIWKIKHVPNHQPAYCLVGLLVSKTLISCVCWIVKLLIDPFAWLAYWYQTLSLVVDVEQSSCWLILLFGWFVDFKPYHWFQLSLNLPPPGLCVKLQSIDPMILWNSCLVPSAPPGTIVYQYTSIVFQPYCGWQLGDLILWPHHKGIPVPGAHRTQNPPSPSVCQLNLSNLSNISNPI